jgi:outer membrane protein assembly factor BamE (lipoprotein component of BamABCDE complex)
MKYTIHSLILAAACAFAGCASPAQNYAKQHPELSSAQAQILNTGKVPDGTAIAGMTRDQVTLALGEPTQYTKVDGHDAWVYVRKQLGTNGINSANDATFDHRDVRSKHSLAEGESHAPQDQPLVKTTVHFEGDKATRAEVVNGGL